MSNVYRLDRRSDAIAAASEWIARIDRGLSAQEELALREWLNSEENNPQALMKLAQLYDKLDSMARLADLFPTPQERRGRSFSSLAVAASAAVILLFAIAATVFSIQKGRGPRELSRQARAVATLGETLMTTGVGERSTVDLPDGSQLVLNTDTAVRMRFSATTRTLFLDRGEVHVQVAHDPLRPFNVYVRNDFVQAVGTEFNVRITSEQHIELLVTEGKVLVGLREQVSGERGRTDRDIGDQSASPAAQLVSAGGLVLLGEENKAVKQLTPEQIVVKLSWRSGNLVFHGESLAQAINEIQRYTPVEFIISDESLKKIRVAGLFKTGDVEGLLKTLKENFNVSYRRIGADKIVLASGDAQH